MNEYAGALRHIARRWIPYGLVYLGIVAAMALLFLHLPTGFLPDEDQGVAFVLVQLPPGAVLSRTVDAEKAVEHEFLVTEKAAVKAVFCISGFSNAGQGQNAGQCFVLFRPFDQRRGASNKAQAVVQRAFGAFSQVRDAMIIPLIPPSVPELGNATGFDLELEDQANLGHDALVAAQGQLLGMASHDPTLTGVRPNSLPDQPQLAVDIDQSKATALGLSLADVDDTIGTAWGSSYVNDFVDRGRVKHVYVQGDAPLSQQARRSERLVCPRLDRRAHPLLGLLDQFVARGGLPAPALQRHSRAGDPGPAGAGPQLGRGLGQGRSHGEEAALRHRSGVDRPVL